MTPRDRRTAAAPHARMRRALLARGAVGVALVLTAAAVRSLIAPAATLAAPALVVVVDAITDDAATVSWSSVDGSTSYVVRRDGTEVAESLGRSYRDSGLGAGERHSWRVTAMEGASPRHPPGARSSRSAVLPSPTLPVVSLPQAHRLW